jgi:hypothetical protein
MRKAGPDPQSQRSARAGDSADRGLAAALLVALRDAGEALDLLSKSPSLRASRCHVPGGIFPERSRQHAAFIDELGLSTDSELSVGHRGDVLSPDGSIRREPLKTESAPGHPRASHGSYLLLRV